MGCAMPTKGALPHGHQLQLRGEFRQRVVRIRHDRRCPADIDGGGHVDVADLLVFLPNSTATAIRLDCQCQRSAEYLRFPSWFRVFIGFRNSALVYANWTEYRRCSRLETPQLHAAKRAEHRQHVGHVHRAVAVHVVVAGGFTTEFAQDVQDVSNRDLKVAVGVAWAGAGALFLARRSG